MHVFQDRAVFAEGQSFEISSSNCKTEDICTPKKVAYWFSIKIKMHMQLFSRSVLHIAMDRALSF